MAYHTEQPEDDPKAAIAITTRLLQDSVEEGRSIALEVLVENRTEQGQPMTLAVVGLPAGLELPGRMLDDRRKDGAFDFWELRGRELALYWRSLAPGSRHLVQFDLLAVVPGTSAGPASRAALYYTPNQVRWTRPLRVEVTAAR